MSQKISTFIHKICFWSTNDFWEQKDDWSKLTLYQKAFRLIFCLFSTIAGSISPVEARVLRNRIAERLSTAYSLEKMRKAIAKLKESMELEKNLERNMLIGAQASEDDEKKKAKRVAVKKEKVEFDNNEWVCANDPSLLMKIIFFFHPKPMKPWHRITVEESRHRAEEKWFRWSWQEKEEKTFSEEKWSE